MNSQGHVTYFSFNASGDYFCCLEFPFKPVALLELVQAD